MARPVSIIVRGGSGQRADMNSQALANCEIIAVGSELLTPDRLDTNSLYLTDQLNGIGVEVRRKSIIGDDRARLAAEVRAALANSEIVILTGGLGPTEDDVTRDSVADALGRTLVFRQDLLDTLMERFQRLNRKMADNNRRQTFIVEGAEPLPNPRGTAPGQWIETDRASRDACLPRPSERVSIASRAWANRTSISSSRRFTNHSRIQ